MSYENVLRRARRKARAGGYTLAKGVGDQVQVVVCETCHGPCKADRAELADGHWRSRTPVYTGTLGQVLAWLG